jgi:hypothetical protein
MVNKLLHRVLTGLREGGAGLPDGINTAEIARRLLCGDVALEGLGLESLARDHDSAVGDNEGGDDDF